MNIPNLLTVFRILSAIPLALILTQSEPNIVLALIIIILAYFSDAVDGIIARKFNQATEFGSRFDIYGDRINDFCLWFIFCYLGIFHAIMPILVVIRNLFTDAVREHYLLTKHQKPFEVSTTPFAKFIMASRFSRGFNGFLKLATFIFAIITLKFPTLNTLTQVVAWTGVAFNLARGLPVIGASRSLFGLPSSNNQ